MQMSSLKDSFLNYCEKNNYEKNIYQLKIIDLIIKFFDSKKIFFDFIRKNKKKNCFYLYGGVGVGKTMILNFVYNFLYMPKQRLHFNEFMISFHDFVFKNKENKQENIIDKFVAKLKSKIKLIYFYELKLTKILNEKNFFFK